MKNILLNPYDKFSARDSEDSVKQIIFHDSLKKIEFTTEIQITIKGLITINTQIKNTNAFGKYKVQTIVNVCNENENIFRIKIDPIIVSGKFTAIFSTHSSTVTKTINSSIKFNDLEIKHPEHIQYFTKDIDSQITETGKKLRILRILSSSDSINDYDQNSVGNSSVASPPSSEITNLKNTLAKLKTERIKIIENANLYMRFNSLSFNVEHFILS